MTGTPDASAAAVMAANPRATQTREELRTVLLGTSRSIFREEGIGVGTDALTLKRAIDRLQRDTGVRLTNVSLIRRMWENQADCRTDVLVGIASDGGILETAQTLDALAPVLEGLAPATPGERRAARREVCRVGGEADVDASSARTPRRCGSPCGGEPPPAR